QAHRHPTLPTPGKAGALVRGPLARARGTRLQPSWATPRNMVAPHGKEPCPPAFQTSTLPSSSRAPSFPSLRLTPAGSPSAPASLTPAKRLNLVDGARLELAFHGCRPWVIPLYEPPNRVSQRERRISASSWRERSSSAAEPSHKLGRDE